MCTGVALGFSYSQTRNLLTPITIHAVWNSGVILLLTFLQVYIIFLSPFCCILYVICSWSFITQMQCTSLLCSVIQGAFWRRTFFPPPSPAGSWYFFCTKNVSSYTDWYCSYLFFGKKTHKSTYTNLSSLLLCFSCRDTISRSCCRHLKRFIWSAYLALNFV
jgi:hypothetical protein